MEFELEKAMQRWMMGRYSSTTGGKHGFRAESLGTGRLSMKCLAAQTFHFCFGRPTTVRVERYLEPRTRWNFARSFTHPASPTPSRAYYEPASLMLVLVLMLVCRGAWLGRCIRSYLILNNTTVLAQSLPFRQRTTSYLFPSHHRPIDPLTLPIALPILTPRPPRAHCHATTHTHTHTHQCISETSPLQT